MSRKAMQFIETSKYSNLNQKSSTTCVALLFENWK